MPETRKPPNAGGKKIAGIDTKWWLIGGGAAALAVLYSYRKAKANVAPTVGSTATDASGNPIDPNTGLPYTDSGYGAYGFNPAMGSPFSLLGTNTVATSPVTTTTNRDWYQQAVAALEGHGYTAGATAALAEYLMGLPLTSEQLGTVQAAMALVGPPPNYIKAHTTAQVDAVRSWVAHRKPVTRPVVHRHPTPLLTPAQRTKVRDEFRNIFANPGKH